MKVKQQPANSPTFNALDCGVFNSSVQKVVYCTSPKNIDELISTVKGAFNAIPKETLDNVYLLVQLSMRDCLQVAGENTVGFSHAFYQSNQIT